MSTLKQAVESGRRWRYAKGEWQTGYGHLSLTVHEALSHTFEIEPEPEKPREWRVHYFSDDSNLYLDRPCDEPSVHATHVRVHDADQCEKLHHRCAHSCWKTHSTIDP